MTRHISENCQWCQDGNHVYSPMPDYPDAHVYVGGVKWIQFTKRTDDPKLAWLEMKLRERGIASRRAKIPSFHAPILEVQEKDRDAAWLFLSSPMDESGESVDDVADDDPMFLVE